MEFEVFKAVNCDIRYIRSYQHQEETCLHRQSIILKIAAQSYNVPCSSSAMVPLW